MKRFVLFILLLFYFSASFATDYYSQALQTDPNAFASWNTIPTGGGAIPASFTNTGDRFYIQGGHSMTTTGVWTIGSGTSFLVIQNGATLQADHLIQFDGTFQIDNGGIYIHNNNGTVAQTPASTSIFSGTESFGASSNFEIRDWQSNINGLPNTTPGIAWGNLIVNLQVNLTGAWNWNINTGSTLTINGNLDIRSTYLGGIARELRFTGTGNQTINVGGNFLISGSSIVNLKDNAAGAATGNLTMQVNGNVSLTGTSQLNLGNPISGATVGVFDLRFKGNFSAVSGTTVTSGSSTAPYLVANGTGIQTFSCVPQLNCNFKVAQGATVSQVGSLSNNSGRIFAVLGTYNDNGLSTTLSGPLEVAGGIFNATGPLAMGVNRCRVCTGDGTYTGGAAEWCTGTGSRGRINITANTLSFNQNPAATLLVGSGSSPGDLYMTNNAKVEFVSGGGGTGSVTLTASSILSIDDNSYITGLANYSATGGTLRIGSPDGITPDLNITTGNIRVGGTKVYTSGVTVNNFEYFGTSQQVTGMGLPPTITGFLKINNTTASGAVPEVILSYSTQINPPGILDLTVGKLSTLPNLLSLADNVSTNGGNSQSYVVGPLRKFGDEDFTFPIGNGIYFAPLALFANGNPTSVTDNFTATYYTNNPQVANPGIFSGFDHMSWLEYWYLLGDGSTHTKQVQLTVSTFSDATQLSSLVVAHWLDIIPDPNVWQSRGQSGNSGGVSTGTITSNDINFVEVFNPLTLASTSTFPNNPLPINLISFDAIKLTNTKSCISWELAACCSAAAKFEVQRAGSNRNFITVGMTGGSETNRFYTHNDNGLKTGINYYRLKMTDADGTVTYSRTVAIMNGVGGLLLTSLSPTIITSTATLTVTSSKEQKLDIIIVDMQGRVVRRQNLLTAAGNNTIAIEAGNFVAGMYQLYGISEGEKTNVIRFVKQ